MNNQRGHAGIAIMAGALFLAVIFAVALSARDQKQNKSGMHEANPAQTFCYKGLVVVSWGHVGFYEVDAATGKYVPCPAN